MTRVKRSGPAVIVTAALGLFFLITAFEEGAYSGPKSKPEPVIFLTTSPEEKLQTNEFDCAEKIYLYAELGELKEGPHKAEAHWKNPKGRLQQVSSHEFTTGGKPYAVWLWLKLLPSTGGELFGDIDPSIGMGEFFGRWKVKLYLDGEFIAERVFYVAC